MRLPIDTRDNSVASRHIFLDWKNYVDNSLTWLVEHGWLYSKEIKSEEYEGDEKEMRCKSTDGKYYDYTEYYLDESMTIPLIDYSYRYKINELGLVEILKDRWDFWTEYDFLPEGE